MNETHLGHIDPGPPRAPTLNDILNGRTVAGAYLAADDAVHIVLDGGELFRITNQGIGSPQWSYTTQPSAQQMSGAPGRTMSDYELQVADLRIELDLMTRDRNKCREALGDIQ